MAELRTLVEREMDRAGSPSYSFVDLARRRDRKQRNQRIGAGVVALAMAAAVGLLLGRSWWSAQPVPLNEPTPSPVEEPTPRINWQGMWPQATLEEAEKAQRRADAGDPDFTWQVGIDPANAEGDDVGAPIATRFVESELGWDRYRTVAGSGGQGTWDLVFIRCDSGRANVLYPDDPEGGNCAPTIDQIHYETVTVRIEQPIQKGPSGIWIVTRSAELPDSDAPIHDADWFSRQYEQAVPPTEAELLRFVEAFLDARVAGEGAEEYLLPFPEVPLLYATSGGASYERSEVGRVEWGPQWPDGAFRVTVRLFANAGDVMVEQGFTVWLDENRRFRLGYYHGDTTENGATVAERYGILGGRVTFEAGDPWFSPWFTGVVDGDESILVGPAEGAYFVVISDPWVPVRPGCTGAPATTDELTRWIVASSELDTSAPGSVTVGGIEAVRIDVAKTPGARACEDELDTQPGDKLGMLVVFAHGETSPDPHPWSVKHDERMRIYLLDLPGEPARSLAIMIIAPAADFEDVLAEATPIVDSFGFTAET